MNSQLNSTEEDTDEEVSHLILHIIVIPNYKKIVTPVQIEL